MSDLITSLRALAAAKHDDLSVAAEAADEIERLQIAGAPGLHANAWAQAATARAARAKSAAEKRAEKAAQLEAEVERLREEVKQLREALIEWDALIKHKYTGSRDAMSDMQYAAFKTADLLKEMKEDGR